MKSSRRQHHHPRARSLVVNSVLCVYMVAKSCVNGWTTVPPGQRIVGKRSSHLSLLSDDKFLEDDLVALRIKDANPAEDDTQVKPRLCVVRPDGGVHPLCTREDDVETDLYIDPRLLVADDICDDDIVGTYGEGWYSQRPVPSLGGGPGYGADADPVWSIDDELVEKLRDEGIDVPVLDVGIAHGEKARGGAF